jgi:hypothetical protein
VQSGPRGRARDDFYKKLDGATIQQAAKTHLDANNYVGVVLMPEKKQ